MFHYSSIRQQLHRIPELGFQEFKTQQFLLDYIHRLPQNRLVVEKWKTGLFVRVHGTEGKITLGYRADIDGLPIQEQTGLPYKSEHEGTMHACGHDFHMTIALGLLTKFVNEPITADVVFFFQPAEEGPGGALPMIQSEQFASYKPDMIVGLHIAPEHKVGTIAVKPGMLFANTSELVISLVGKGGHAAFPHKTNDATIAACQLVMNLQTIVSRNINPLDSAVVTIGKLTSGTVQNVIAQHAVLEGTIRTRTPESMQLIKTKIQGHVASLETAFDVRGEIDWGSNYWCVWNDEKWTSHFMDFVQNKQNVNLFECEEAMTGEDFGYFLKEVPGFMFWLGVDSSYGLHHSELSPNEDAIPVAINTMYDYFESIITI